MPDPQLDYPAAAYDETDDPDGDGLTQVLPFSELVFVTIVVVALLIAAFMLYPD